MVKTDEEGVKISGIRQIVRLKEILRKWQNVTFSSRIHGGGITPNASRRIKNSGFVCDSGEGSSRRSPEQLIDVPKGFLGVYVGKDLPRRRFIIPTAYLSHHLFKLLLEKAEEEFGFDHGGGLTIPCEIETFKYLVNCIEKENQVKGEHSNDTEKCSTGESCHGA